MTRATQSQGGDRCLRCNAALPALKFWKTICAGCGLRHRPSWTLRYRILAGIHGACFQIWLIYFFVSGHSIQLRLAALALLIAAALLMPLFFRAWAPVQD